MAGDNGGDGVFLWYWGHGNMPDEYHGGFGTKQEAIDDARDNAYDEGYGFTIVEADKKKPSFYAIDAGFALDNFVDNNEELWGEDGACLEETTRDQQNDLEARLAKTLEQWFTDHKVDYKVWTFGTERNKEYIEKTPDEDLTTNPAV